jgi:hypothetical protein
MSEQPVAKAATYTKYDKYRRQNIREPAGFQPGIPAIKRLQTYALEARLPKSASNQ